MIYNFSVLFIIFGVSGGKDMHRRLLFEKRKDGSWRRYIFADGEAQGYRTWCPGGRVQWEIVDTSGRIQVFCGVPIPSVFLCQENGTLVLKVGCRFFERCEFAGQWV